MKKMKYLIFILFVASVMFACNNEKEKLQINLYEMIEQNGSLFDTAISKKHKQVYKKLAEVVAANLRMQNDTIVFMGKNEFLSKGFSETLYNQFVQDIEFANALIIKDSIWLNEFKRKLPLQMTKLRERVAKW
jgi:hypothetical protein